MSGGQSLLIYADESTIYQSSGGNISPLTLSAKTFICFTSVGIITHTENFFQFAEISAMGGRLQSEHEKYRDRLRAAIESTSLTPGVSPPAQSVPAVPMQTSVHAGAGAGRPGPPGLLRRLRIGGYRDQAFWAR